MKFERNRKLIVGVALLLIGVIVAVGVVLGPVVFGTSTQSILKLKVLRESGR